MEKKHYYIVDRNIVFFEEDSNKATGEIQDRLEEMFKGALFHNTVDHTYERAENVTLEIEISESTGTVFFVVKANLTSKVPIDLEIHFAEGDTTLQYINERFVHVQEYEFFSAGVTGNIELLLPGETKPSTDFVTYVFKNL